MVNALQKLAPLRFLETLRGNGSLQDFHKQEYSAKSVKPD
jgi:hypothetical protein